MMHQDDTESIRAKSSFRWALHLVTALSLCLALLLTACSSDKTADKKTKKAETETDSASVSAERENKGVDIKYTPPDVPVDLNGKPVEVAGAKFVPDTKWEDLGPSGKMVAHYRYGPLEKDTEQAEVTVFFLGDEPNDSQEIMERWMDQISFADGRDSRSSARLHDRVVGGMTAYVLSTDGIYTPPTEGFDRDDTGVKEYSRLVGVVLEAPGGLVYFKLTGPEYTGRVMIDQFMNMIYRVVKT